MARLALALGVAQLAACEPAAPAAEAEECGPVVHIGCGDRIASDTSTAEAGPFGTRWYNRWRCWPGLQDRDLAGERVFVLDLVEGQDVIVELRSDHDQLGLTTLTWPSLPVVRPLGRRITSAAGRTKWVFAPSAHCETSTPAIFGPPTEHHLFSESGLRWWVIVEGVGGVAGAFELGVTCIASQPRECE